MKKKTPQHRTHNPRRVSHAHGLAILRFRSPLLTESHLFSLPTGTEMFHFPAFPPAPYVFSAGNTTSLVPGFPIRTSSDPRSVDSSPRHIAASHVLHRLPVPRHPPCALKHLQHKTKKILRKTQKLHITHTNNTPTTKKRSAHLHARCSQPLSTNQTPHPTTKAGQQQPTPTRHPRGHHLRFPTRDEEIAGLLSQSPIVCLTVPSPAVSPPASTFVVHQNHTHYRRQAIQRIA